MGDPLGSLRLTFGAIGVVGLLVGATLALSRVALMRARHRAAGEVTSVVLGARVKTASGSSARSRTVVVRFTTDDSTSIEARDDNAMGAYSEGQPVIVYYDPFEPSDAIVAGLMRFWFLPAVFGGLGGMFLGLALGL